MLHNNVEVKLKGLCLITVMSNFEFLGAVIYVENDFLLLQKLAMVPLKKCFR